MIDRPYYEKIWTDLSAEKAMVFLAGPRQTGKTTLAKKLARSYTTSSYFNWDIQDDRKRLATSPYFFQDIQRRDDSIPLVILDEIHKYNRWKDYLKGVYDGFADRFHFLVLGSGRLQTYQRGGDSLAGRYRLFSLWPLTLSELVKSPRSMDSFEKNPLAAPPAASEAQPIWNHLEATSGFPEPYALGKRTSYERWVRSYDQQLIRQDIRDLTGIKHIDQVEMLYSLLPSRVASPLSIDSLAKDLRVAFNSVDDWLNVFESFYMVFRLSPWSRSISRSLQKSKKLYFFDYARLSDPGTRFENHVALELWRAVSCWNDMGLGKWALHYARTKEQQEVDFVMSRDGKPIVMVEAKLSDLQPDKSLFKLQQMLNVPALQLVGTPGIHKTLKNGALDMAVISASRWLSHLP